MATVFFYMILERSGDRMVRNVDKDLVVVENSQATIRTKLGLYRATRPVTTTSPSQSKTFPSSQGRLCAHCRHYFPDLKKARSGLT
jgi:hypothetical protein